MAAAAPLLKSGQITWTRWQAVLQLKNLISICPRFRNTKTSRTCRLFSPHRGGRWHLSVPWASLSFPLSSSPTWQDECISPGPAIMRARMRSMIKGSEGLSQCIVCTVMCIGDKIKEQDEENRREEDPHQSRQVRIGSVSHVDRVLTQQDVLDIKGKTKKEGRKILENFFAQHAITCLEFCEKERKVAKAQRMRIQYCTSRIHNLSYWIPIQTWE